MTRDPPVYQSFSTDRPLISVTLRGSGNPILSKIINLKTIASNSRHEVKTFIEDVGYRGKDRKVRTEKI